MSERKIVVKSIVQNGKECSVVSRQHELGALTDCSELLDVAHAQVEEGLSASTYGFTATGPHGESVSVVLENDEDFVTDYTQNQLDGCSNVTFFAEFETQGSVDDAHYVHHIHPDEHHLADLSIVDGVTPEELEHCHNWGVYTVKQAKEAHPFQVPESLLQRLAQECKTVFKPAQAEPVAEPVSSAGFDLGLQMGYETRFMHAHAPLNRLAKDNVWALSFAIDPETVYVSDEHQEAIQPFTTADNRGAIGTHVDMHPVMGRDKVGLKLRHSDTSVLSGDATHEQTFDLGQLDLAKLTSTEQTVCNDGHVYKHSIEQLENGWTLNKASVVLNDAMVGQANFAFLQSDDRSMLIYCSLFTTDPDALTVGSEAPETNTEIIQTFALALRWNGTNYMRRDSIKTWPENDQTRFGDLYVMALNNLAASLPNDFPSIDGIDAPTSVDVEITWRNANGQEVRYNEEGRVYRELWYKNPADESSWKPQVIGTYGDVRGRQESFDPQTGDDLILVAFNVGKSTDIGASASSNAQTERVTEPGRYRLLPNFQGGHVHTVELDSRLNGVSTYDSGHVHMVVDGVVQPAAGHTHKAVLM